MTTLGTAATIVRSKNAGPYTITIDVFFGDFQTYQTVIGASALTEASIAGLYGLEDESVVDTYHLDELQAIKISLPRPIPAGDVTDTDVYGMQQYIPLLSIEIDSISP